MKTFPDRDTWRVEQSGQQSARPGPQRQRQLNSGCVKRSAKPSLQLCFPNSGQQGTTGWQGTAIGRTPDGTTRRPQGSVSRCLLVGWLVIGLQRPIGHIRATDACRLTALLHSLA